MSRVLVLGYELPALAEGAVEARSYRTWQFVEPLVADGHHVCLIISGQADRFKGHVCDGLFTCPVNKYAIFTGCDNISEPYIRDTAKHYPFTLGDGGYMYGFAIPPPVSRMQASLNNDI